MSECIQHGVWDGRQNKTKGTTGSTWAISRETVWRFGGHIARQTLKANHTAIQQQFSGSYHGPFKIVGRCSELAAKQPITGCGTAGAPTRQCRPAMLPASHLGYSTPPLSTAYCLLYCLLSTLAYANPRCYHFPRLHKYLAAWRPRNH
jgi:hypothetical protein